MSPLHELESRLQAELPDIKTTRAEPARAGGVGFLDLEHHGQVLTVQWQQDWGFGVSSPEGHGYGEKPDESYATAAEAAHRIIRLFSSGERTHPPSEITLRELRILLGLPQIKVAQALGVQQSAVSRMEVRGPGMALKTLRDFVQALGCKLSLGVELPNGEMHLLTFEEQTTEPQHSGAS